MHIHRSIRSEAVSVRMIRQGLPAAKLWGGMSRVTTLPAPITLPAPMVTPPQTTTFDASQQSFPIVMGFAYSRL